MLSAKRKRQWNQAKGALFEAIVRNLLVKANYAPIAPDNICIRKGNRNVRGRGCWHNVDAFGKLSYRIPYVYPIRLLVEAKCYRNDPVELPVVRNFLGAFKDISENYFIRDKISRGQMLTYNRYADCGAIFSASDFSADAQRFALAHGISLISYQNNSILRQAVDSIYALRPTIDIALASEYKSDFSAYIYQKLTKPLQNAYWSSFILREQRDTFFEIFKELYGSLERIKTSAIAIAIGQNPEVQYPVHLLSYESIPERVFAESDAHPVRIHYSISENGLIFRATPEETSMHIYFTVPKGIYENYFARRRMLDFKYKFLRYIELQTIVRRLRRIVTFELNTDWLEEERAASSEHVEFS